MTQLGQPTVQGQPPSHQSTQVRLPTLDSVEWMHALPLPVLIVDGLEGQIVEANQSCLHLLRYEREELLKLSLADLRVASGIFRITSAKSHFAAALGSRTSLLARRDGSTFEAELSAQEIGYKGHRAQVIVIQDVSRSIHADTQRRDSERRYRWLVENITETVWRIELEVPVPVSLSVDEQIERFYEHGILAEANSSMAKAYGYPTQAAMIGMRLGEILPKLQAHNLNFLKEFIRNGYRLADAESIETDSNGNVKWFSNRFVGDVEAGCLVRAWGSSRDITEAKLAKQRQQQSERLWYDALQSIHLLAVFLDAAGRVTFANPYFAESMGWRPEDLIGANWFSTVLKQEDNPGVTADHYAHRLQARSIHPHRTNVVTAKDGSKRTVQWNNTLVFGENQQPVGVFSLGEDITDRVRADVALRESEERYRRLVEDSPLGVYRSTPDGKLTFCNSTFARHFGFGTPQEALSIDLESASIGPTYSRSEFRERMEQEDEIRGLEATWQQPGGNIIWVREHARAVRNAEGRVQYYEGTIEDITAEKVALQAKLESEEQHRMLMQLAPIGIFMSRNAILVNVNQILVRMLGYASNQELLGKSLLELLHPAEREEIKKNYLDAPPEYGLLPMQERRFLRKDGSSILIQAHIARVKVNNERGSIVVMRDITAERQAEQERRRWQYRMLEMQKLESLGSLAGGLAHDFNNQLTVISGHVHLAKKTLPHDAQAVGLLTPVELAARHAADLCQQMLSFAGRGRIEVSQVNLSDLVEDTTGLLKVSCHKKARLNAELAPDLPLIHAEPGQLRQVLINLIQNAADAIVDPPGVIDVRTFATAIDESYPNSEITLELPHGHYVGLEVSDTGCGMDINTRRRIFEPFFTTKPAGRGLGLAAVLGIVRSHGGAIEVNSKLKQGTTFRVFLPIQRTRQLEDSAFPTDLRNKSADSSECILVVDDESSLRALAATVLSKHGWTVIEAENGYAALEIIREKQDKISLVMVDLAMPGLDGVETLRSLWDIRPGLPAIAMSSYGTMELERRFAGFPLLGVLAKPFTPAGLLQAMEHALGVSAKI